jgi:hypothetical protein
MGLVTDFAISERKDSPVRLGGIHQKVLRPLQAARWLAKSSKN